MKGVDAYCAVAGAGDLAAGTLLLGAPGAVARLLAAPAPLEPVAWRWIGAFVAAVGALYLYPLALGAADRLARRRTVLEATALVRAAVGLFVAVAVAAGALAAAWATVAVYDLALAAVQAVVLRRLAGAA